MSCYLWFKINESTKARSVRWTGLKSIDHCTCSSLHMLCFLHVFILPVNKLYQIQI